MTAKSPRSRNNFGRLAAGLLVAICGCSTGDLPELGQVKGVVTLDGQPLAGVWVGFAPTNKGRSSMGLTNQDGQYELNYLNDVAGAKIGSHTVTITTPVEDESGAEVKNFKERIPSQYNTKTTLTAEVQSGSNQIDFKLESTARGRK